MKAAQTVGLWAVQKDSRMAAPRVARMADLLGSKDAMRAAPRAHLRADPLVACLVDQKVALWDAPRAGPRAGPRVASRAARKAAMSEPHSSGF